MRKDCDDFSSIKHRIDSQKKKNIYIYISSIEFKLLAIYPPMIWTKFKLLICDLKFDIST